MACIEVLMEGRKFTWDCDIDFGPKPFKVFDTRLDEPDIEVVVADAWEKSVKGSRPDCIFRDKLKNVKVALKTWSKDRFGNMDDQIEKYRTQAMDWEIHDENRSLNDVALTSWMDARKGWIEKERDKGNMLRQKARIKWDVKGDENSKFFHLMIRRRYNRNNIRGLLVNGGGSHWLGDFRPISLIGCYYKIICENVSGKAKKVVPKLVGNVQNTFISGRFILDGVLIANETVDFLRKKKKKGLISKVGFEKVYDSVSWRFLGDMMETMGFGCKWRRWIMTCFHYASMSILVNVSRTDEFVLEIGIRQGDPLSPFLFILAAKGLDAIVSEAVSYGVLRGINVGVDQVLVSYLQYADDTIFFGEWDKSNAQNLMYTLNCFEKMASDRDAEYALSKLLQMASPEIKVSLDANKDIDVDEVSSAIESVFDIDESNVESMEVCSKFGEFLENKKSVEEVVVGDGEALGVD
nr:cysteine-rich receptor-like protein kinase [Tanacetum cinerariifolium]